MKLSLRPLETELGVGLSASDVAGVHDFERLSVEFDCGSSLLVARHEAIHDRLIWETPFGTIQGGLRAAASRVRSESLRSGLESAFAELLTGSRLTHERAATYLSIKSFPQGEHAKLLSFHPFDYQVYYQDVSTVIDTTFASSYLQYLIAITLIEICLSSNLQEKLIDWNPEERIPAPPEDLPDFRFRVVAEMFSESRQQELLCCIRDRSATSNIAALKGSRFDPNNEASWLALKALGASHVDEFFHHCIRDWMYPFVAQELPILQWSQWMPVRRRFFRHLSDCCGIAFQLLELTADEATTRSAVYTLAEVARIHRESMGQLRSAAPGTKIPPLFISDDEVSPKLLSATPALSRNLISIAPPADWRHQGPAWIYNSLTKNECHRAVLKHSQFERLTRQLTILGTTGMLLPSLDVIVDPVHFRQSFPDLYRTALSWFSLGNEESSILMSVGELVWYMSGDIVAWISWLSGLGSLKMAIIDLNDPRIDSSRAAESLPLSYDDWVLGDTPSRLDMPATVVFLRCEGVFGSFVRIMNAEASTNALAVSFEETHRQIHGFETKELDQITRKANAIVNAVINTWEYF